MPGSSAVGDAPDINEGGAPARLLFFPGLVGTGKLVRADELRKEDVSSGGSFCGWHANSSMAGTLLRRALSGIGTAVAAGGLRRAT